MPFIIKVMKVLPVDIFELTGKEKFFESTICYNIFEQCIQSDATTLITLITKEDALTIPTFIP